MLLRQQVRSFSRPVFFWRNRPCFAAANYVIQIELASFPTDFYLPRWRPLGLGRLVRNYSWPVGAVGSLPLPSGEAGRLGASGMLEEKGFLGCSWDPGNERETVFFLCRISAVGGARPNRRQRCLTYSHQAPTMFQVIFWVLGWEQSTKRAKVLALGELGISI